MAVNLNNIKNNNIPRNPANLIGRSINFRFTRKYARKKNRSALTPLRQLRTYVYLCITPSKNILYSVPPLFRRGMVEKLLFRRFKKFQSIFLLGFWGINNSYSEDVYFRRSLLDNIFSNGKSKVASFKNCVTMKWPI